MQESAQLYSVLVNASEVAFAGRQHMAAYHALSAAMYCALDARDADKLENVMQLACTQIDELSERLGANNFPDEPIELCLYRSLIQVGRTRLLLFRK